MALNLDNRLYTGGSERFDSSPHTQLYTQLLAKEQAKKEAFDEYIRNLNKGVNSAGMRNQDRQVFDQKMAAWQKNGMENRDKIRKRTNGADIQFMNEYQDILNLIAESKTAEERKKPLVEILTDPAKRDRLSADIIPEIAAHDQPLYIIGKDGSLERNPDRRDFDISKMSFDPKPFEQDKYFKQFDDVKRTDLPPSIYNDPKTLMQTITTTSAFDQEAKDVIAQRAVTDYVQNPSFKKVVDGLNKDEYNPTFKANYGRDIQTPADLAAAYTLKGLQQKVTTSKVNQDTLARQEKMAAVNDRYARGRLALGQQYKKDLINFRNAGTQKDQDQVLEDWIQRSYNEGELTNVPVRVKGSFVPVKKIAVPMDMKKKYTITNGTGTDKETEVPRFVMTRDKKFVVPLYPNKPSDYQEPIPIETFRNELGKLWLSAKDRVGEMDEISFDNEDGEEDVIETASAPSSVPASGSETIEKSKVPKGAQVTKDAQGNIYYQGKKIKM